MKLYATWYHLYNLKNVKNAHGEAILLERLEADACMFTKNNTLPWVFFTILICTNGTKSPKAYLMKWETK